ncbi:hypothetical protein EJC49_20675 [Aquibium carbonis]|uniref:Uncharacterized protein n=1 Tax=Aquibium carbonis TaxID=2495581 RepID=A0A429YST1_9HYPH|nr:hypothetical protein [Aquibium carbonis]RST84519.1 hypothetical protein EJC49_20675 [Aquibium carbonis]
MKVAVAALPLAGRPMSGAQGASGMAPREQGLLATTMTALIAFPDPFTTGRSDDRTAEYSVGATLRGPARRLVGVSASAMRKTISRNIMASQHHENAEI